MNKERPQVLSIAGFDPSAGAGLLADVKTFEANGVYGLGVVSALTWQNDKEFDRVEWLSIDKITSQVDVLLRRFDIKYIKIGLIESAYVLRQLVSYLYAAIEKPFIVYDPILKASAGFAFHNANDIAEALLSIQCITPNIPEAERLFGKEDMLNNLKKQSEYMGIYLKGGHSEGTSATDLLLTRGRTYEYTNARLPHGEKHGSGCVLSAAITAQLALGNPLPEACRLANAYTHGFLASNDTLLGYHKMDTLCLQ